MIKHLGRLETVAVSVTEDMLEAFEAALANACSTVGFFRDQDTGLWRVEGVKQVGVNDAELASSLSVAAIMTGVSPVLCRSATEADGWLARTHASFPEQLIGTRFAVRGTHLTGSKAANRITVTLDAGLAFGSGEHGSTRGCLRALERVAWRRPRRILDLGCGSGILALASARVGRGYRAVVGARGRGERRAEPAGPPGTVRARRRLDRRGGAGRRTVR